MLTLDLIAEQRIAEAVARGELSDLPGQGEPLELSDDTLIPEELRMAYRVLKNAGFTPPHVEQLNQIHDLQQLIPSLDDHGAWSRAIRRLNLLMAQTAAGRRHGNLRIEGEYFDKLSERLPS